MNYSNTIVSGMLSWLRGIANWAINLFNLSGERSLSLLTWFSEHWIGLLVTLILIGLAIDWLVWIIRWRPYWVWFRTKRILIDDTDAPRPRGRFSREDDDWDGEEDDARARRSRKSARRQIEPDFFSVDPATAYESDDLDFADNAFQPSANVDEDPFSIASDDPNAITFWQEDIFKTTDLEANNRPRTRTKHN